MKLKPEFHKLNPGERLYRLPVPLIGLTGGIATGKSTVSSLLEKKGLPLIDADQLVKSIYRQQETVDFVAKEFPQTILEGEINFPLLREKVFSDKAAKEKIESFIYQRLPAEFMRSFEAKNAPEFILYDVPLLFEKSLESKFDLKLLVYAPREIQLARLLKRDGTGRELADKIIDQQMDIETKRLKADLVINNSLTEAELRAEVDLFIQKAFV